MSWIRRGPRDVISADLVSRDAIELQAQVLKLQRRIDLHLAVVRLLFMLVRLSGARLNQDRLPEGSVKATVLDAISRATKSIPLAIALRVLGLSSSRYHAWRKLGQHCLLDDRQSCPKTSPTQLTAAEVSSMHELVTDEAYRHVPVSRLVLLAQRLKKVVASPATWSKLIRERGWLRP
ncbi:MAG: hypothetical protein HY901_17345, partial [Deltaproteobacteria bacterium]|nr:hypothetical protein [Deltaproteobacteria bacterium]